MLGLKNRISSLEISSKTKYNTTALTEIMLKERYSLVVFNYTTAEEPLEITWGLGE